MIPLLSKWLLVLGNSRGLNEIKGLPSCLQVQVISKPGMETDCIRCVLNDNRLRVEGSLSSRDETPQATAASRLYRLDVGIHSLLRAVFRLEVTRRLRIACQSKHRMIRMVSIETKVAALECLKSKIEVV